MTRSSPPSPAPNSSSTAAATAPQAADFNDMPGAPIESRPLQLIIAADCSGSMSGQKIASLNNALVEAFDALRGVAAENPTARILVRAIAFDSTARWHIPEPTPVDALSWPDLHARGSTDMTGAINLLIDAMDLQRMPERGLPPVLVLVTDGMPDNADSFKRAVAKLIEPGWGKKAVRLGIGIGDDVQADILETFVANPEVPVLFAHNSTELVHWIRWATVVATTAASRPQTQSGTANSAANVIIPNPTPLPATAADVW